MADMVFKNIAKRYPNGYVALENFNLEIKDKEFVVIVGPSGCGKSTLLRMIAGLEDISEGELIVGDKVVNDLEPKDRDIAMVFQNYALYPHMTVFDNMAFNMKLKKIDKETIKETVEKTAETLGLKELLKRKPGQLSGGQRQRVALGRAIVRNPRVFLMDEPLSNLDAKLRMQMRAEISRLHKTLEATVIYVTHDQTEAMTMGDKIVVMDRGVIKQYGTPQEIYSKPKNLFVAQFIGNITVNVVEAHKVDGGFEYCSNVWRVDTEKEPFVGKYKVIFAIRPENLEIVEGDDFEVKLCENFGSEKILYIENDKDELRIKCDTTNTNKIGDNISIRIKDMDKLNVFDAETENCYEI